MAIVSRTLKYTIALGIMYKEHVTGYLVEAQKYFMLSSGYRFLIDDKNCEDVWYETELLSA